MKKFLNFATFILTSILLITQTHQASGRSRNPCGANSPLRKKHTTMFENKTNYPISIKLKARHVIGDLMICKYRHDQSNTMIVQPNGTISWEYKGWIKHITIINQNDMTKQLSKKTTGIRKKVNIVDDLKNPGQPKINLITK
jgi:hypothetical protein